MFVVVKIKKPDNITLSGIHFVDNYSVAYFTSISSTSKTSVAFGGITPPAPREP